MHTDHWHDFLSTQGATWNQQGIANFDQAYADSSTNSTHLIDISQLGCLIV